MNPRLVKIHFCLTFVFYNLVFFPMHNLGVYGHMRRIYDPSQYEFLQPLAPLNTFITVNALLLFATQILFLVAFIKGWFNGEKAGDNPWEANGLEWTVPSPPAHGNFAQVPIVYRGPYEYSSPLVEEDFLLQTRKLDSDVEPAAAGS